MKKLLFSCFTVTYAWCMDPQTGVGASIFEERVIQQYTYTLAKRLRDSDSTSDDMGLRGLFSEPCSAIPQDLRDFGMTPEEFKERLNQVVNISDKSQQLGTPDFVEQVLQLAQYPLMAATLAAAATPHIVFRTTRGITRSPMLYLIANLADSKVFYIICTALLACFYKIRDRWHSFISERRKKEIETLKSKVKVSDEDHAKISSIETQLASLTTCVERIQDELTATTGTHQAINTQQKAQIQDALTKILELRGYVDSIDAAVHAHVNAVAAAADTSFTQIRQDIGQEAETLKACQANLTDMKSIVSASLPVLKDMLERIQRLDTQPGKKKK